jgi:hypothetical protein
MAEKNEEQSASNLIHQIHGISPCCGATLATSNVVGTCIPPRARRQIQDTSETNATALPLMARSALERIPNTAEERIINHPTRTIISPVVPEL